MKRKSLENTEEATKQKDVLPDRKKLGPYTLVEKIGAGGMGVVYKAYHAGLDKYFAIKTILSTEAKDEEIKRFIREARLAAKLSHPNIITVHDVGEDKGQHYIVMDYIKGRDLGDIIAKERLYPRICLEIVRDIAKALDTAHREGIIHRDIKPSNILVAEPERRPFLMDFGLASTVKRETGITRSGQVLGTPKYMSPEQAMGKARRLDARSDIYSLGAVLYEMLCGKPVVEGDQIMNMLYQVVYKDPNPLSRHRKIAQDVEAITMKCLEKDPNRRYQSAEELADDIDRYLNGEPVLARSTGICYRLRKWIQRNKAMTITIASVALVILTINFWYMWEKKETEKNMKERQDKALRIIHEANMYFMLKMHSKAFADFNKAIELDPNLSTAYHNRGNAYYNMNRNQEAFADYSKAVELAPNFIPTYLIRGFLYYAMKRYPEALADFNKAIELAPDSSIIYLMRGTLYYEMKMYPEALADYNKTIELDPNIPESYYHRGKFYSNIKKYEEALEDYNKAVTLNPDIFDIYYERGILYKNIKKYEEALKDYNQAVTLNPNSSEVYNNRGSISMEMKKYEEALKDYNKAIQCNPSFWPAYANRGALYYNIREYGKAISDLEYCKKLGITDPRIDECIRASREAIEKR